MAKVQRVDRNVEQSVCVYRYMGDELSILQVE